MADPTAIVCAACNRRFAFKPHLAGRTMTCKCGASISVPGRAADLERSANIKKMVLLAGAVVCVVAVAIVLVKYGGSFLSSHKSAAPVANLPGADGWVVAQINDGHDNEAEQWIKASKEHAVIGLTWTHEVTQKYIELWYSRNAKKVMAFGDSFWTTALAIELPDDKDQRKYFFDYAANFYGPDKIKREGYPNQLDDVGQKYLVIFFANPFAPPLPGGLSPSDLNK